MERKNLKMKIKRHIIRKLAFPILAGWIPVIIALMLVTAAVTSINTVVADCAFLMFARSSMANTQSISREIVGPTSAPEIDGNVTRDDGREQLKFPAESFGGARGFPARVAKEQSQLR